jgi:hypothetical protein
MLVSKLAVKTCKQAVGLVKKYKKTAVVIGLVIAWTVAELIYQYLTGTMSLPTYLVYAIGCDVFHCRSRGLPLW